MNIAFIKSPHGKICQRITRAKARLSRLRNDNIVSNAKLRVAKDHLLMARSLIREAWDLEKK